MNRKTKRDMAKREGYWQEGSIGDLLSVGLCILAMLAVMMAFMECAGLVHKKTIISQLARSYILRMETTGYLSQAQEDELRNRLETVGVTQIDLTGSTREPVGYGGEIVLRISGKIEGGYDLEEKRVSTAKN